MRPEDFKKKLEFPAGKVADVSSHELRSAAQVVLRSRFISHFTSHDRLSRRYARELPIFHLWGTIFLHSSWLNEGSVFPVHFAALSELTGLTLPTVSRAVSLAVAQGDVVREAFEGDFRRRTIDPTERLFLYRMEKTAALVALWSELTGRPDPWQRITDTAQRDIMSAQCHFVRRSVLGNSNSPIERNQFLVLLALTAIGRTSKDDFVAGHARTIGMTRPGMALLVDRLVARGLLDAAATGAVEISGSTRQIMCAVLGSLRYRFNAFLDLVDDVSLLSGVSALVRREVTTIRVSAEALDADPDHTQPAHARG
jgi:DNA-binding MarR family transcriptional regulator